MDYQLHPLGDQAVVIELGEEINLETQKKVKRLSTFLEKNHETWMVEYIPAFTTVTLFYDLLAVSQLSQNSVLPYQAVCSYINKIIKSLGTDEEVDQRTIEIPVCYGGEFGPDLEYVAEHNDLTPEEVIKIHSEGDYLVYMIGFAPGFPYIGGMSEKIATPRRKSPRLKIPPRTVGIAGMQTGVYPIETPGGWQLIGQTPIKLFRPLDDSPSLLQAGDKIKFFPISYEEYMNWEDDK